MEEKLDGVEIDYDTLFNKNKSIYTQLLINNLITHNVEIDKKNLTKYLYAHVNRGVNIIYTNIIPKNTIHKLSSTALYFGLLVSTPIQQNTCAIIIIPLKNKGAIRLTVAKYYLPSGKSISEVGVSPDIEINEDSDEFRIKTDTDNQLSYALKLLNG